MTAPTSPVQRSPLSRRHLLRRRLLGATGAALLLPRAGRAAGALRLGLTPYLSTRAMLTIYQPLRDHLAQSLARPVQLFTAADFRALAENTRRGDYDLALLPAHMTLLALNDWRFRLVARVDLSSDVQLMAREPLAAGSDLAGHLRGRRIALLDPLSLSALITLRWLAERGLVAERDVEGIYARSAASAALAVDRGEAAALALTGSQLVELSAELSRPLHRLATIATIPTLSYVAPPAVAPAEAARWREALLAFNPAGRAGSVAGTRLVEGGVRDFASVEPQAQALRALLTAPR